MIIWLKNRSKIRYRIFQLRSACRGQIVCTIPYIRFIRTCLPASQRAFAVLTLNERFHQTPFSARVQEDAHGFYRRCAAAFAERSRPCNAERCNVVGGNEGEATGGCGGGSGGSTTGAGAMQWAGPFVFNVPAS